MRRIDFLGLPLDPGLTIDDVCAELRRKDEARLIGYISPASWAVARRHPEYLAALHQMTMIRAGGEGVTRVYRWLTGRPCPRVNFDMTSLADPFFRAAIAGKDTLLLAGGAPGVAEEVRAKLAKAYPGLNVVGTIHGYGDVVKMAEQAAARTPDVVIAAMGSPKQELFLIALRGAGYRGLAITCGGFFDQYLEADDYYPHWINRWNLRFAWRLFKEPRRLWRRYLVDYQIFIWCALKALLRKWAA